jgi:hypothetical protein
MLDVPSFEGLPAGYPPKITEVRHSLSNAMACFILVAIVLLGLFLFGLGLYALIAGQVYLIGGSISGPLARVIGLLLILSTIVGVPMLLRGLVGLSINLGH